LSQQSVGAVDGEIYEHIFYAAVQLASHSYTLVLLDVVDFVHALEPYICKGNTEITLMESSLPALQLELSVQKKLVYKRAKLVWCYKNANTLSRKPEDKVKPKVQEVEDMKKRLCGYKIPWLVPACKGTDLLESHEGLFPDGMIAGLVPSKRNAQFDAHAFVVSQSNAIDWVFEFHGHTSNYDLATAIEDLEGKCTSPEGKSCHAMLIAFSADTKSEACAWLEDKLLRIAVVFGNA